MHKCMGCGTVFKDEDESILNGCPVCGSRFFLFIKDTKEEKKLEKIERELKKKKKVLEEAVKRKKVKKEERKEFGVETVRVVRKGVYEIDVGGLLEGKPLIILEKGGIYLVHLPSVFEKME